MKNISFFFCFFFLSENIQFLEVKCSIYLNRRVFVMASFSSFCTLRLCQGQALSKKQIF